MVSKSVKSVKVQKLFENCLNEERTINSMVYEKDKSEFNDG